MNKAVKTVIYKWFGMPILSGILIMAGCGTPSKRLYQPLIAEKMANAEFAINKAQDSQAHQLAFREFNAAQVHLQKAREAMHQGEYNNAMRLAEKALADATLAEAKAEFESVRQTIK